MPRSRVVRPESTTLQISNGDWLLVKKRLNAGDSRGQFARLIHNVAPGEMPTLDTVNVGLTRILAYLLEWSLVDPQGNVLPLRNAIGELSPETMTASLNVIDPESFGEISKAIEAHEEAMQAEREQEKNDQAGETPSSATLLSAV